jgi:hypothetical protein
MDNNGCITIPHQHELRECLPGARGGLALAEQYGNTHMQRIGRRGGRRTLERNGYAYMRELARRGAAERWRRARLPRTIPEYHAGELLALYRRVPYRRPNSRRRKPHMVFIILWAETEA